MKRKLPIATWRKPATKKPPINAAGADIPIHDIFGTVWMNATNSWLHINPTGIIKKQ
jgi:hypothetical protein